MVLHGRASMCDSFEHGNASDARLSFVSPPGAALAEGSHVSFPRTSLLGYAYSFVRHPLLRIGVWGLVAVMAGAERIVVCSQISSRHCFYTSKLPRRGCFCLWRPVRSAGARINASLRIDRRLLVWLHLPHERSRG